jgi:pimeloyl-ACP methyl ester carboxylesterase
VRRDFLLPGRGDGTLAALEFGPDNRPYDLIFLHANGFNARTYRRILAPLAEHFRILAVDQRGHGATSLPAIVEGRTSWLDLRDDVLALIKSLDARNLVLAGHSMGGTASLMAAADAPERVRSVLLFDPVILPRTLPSPAEIASDANSGLLQGALRRRAEFASREAAVEAYRGRGAFSTWPDDMLADYVDGGFRDLPDGGVRLACEPAWEASNFRSHAHDARTAFHHSRCPVRVLRAETGSTCRIDDDLDALTADGRIAVETIPGTSHFLPMERPQLAAQALALAIRQAPRLNGGG